MLQDQTFRSELDDFVSRGWLGHVLSTKSWWFSADGALKPVRRQNFATAFHDMLVRVRSQLGEPATLYRTLLLGEDFELESLRHGEQDFGEFWTSSMDIADNYKPRRCYQTVHPMPEMGVPYVVQISDVYPDDIDWVATIGCQLANPSLEEVRLKPGTQKSATRVFRANGDEAGRVLRSTPPVPGILPVPEGPGFIENCRLLDAAETALIAVL